MKRGKRTYVALLAMVVGSTLAAVSPVMGQQRIDTSGHAMDANTQIGSGGYNAPQTNQTVGTQYQNALVTNNVTNGAGFRGREFNGINMGVGYNDPFAFRGLLAGQGVDQFIAESTGVPTMANPTASSNSLASPPQVIFGASNNSPPPGFQQLPNGLGFVPAQPMTQSPADTRLGAVDFTETPMLPKPNELLVPGPVDPTAPVNPSSGSQLFAASPLYGVRQWQFNAGQIQPAQDQQLGQQSSSLFGGQSPLQQGSGVTQFNQTPSQTRLLQLRRELNNSSNQGSQQVSQGGANGATLLAPLRPGMASNSNAGPALEPLTVETAQLKSMNIAPEAGDVSTSQSTRQVLSDIPLPPPSQQSSEVALLQQMMQKYQASHPKTDEQANADFQRILRLRQIAATNAERGSNVLGSPRTNEPGANETAPGIPNPEMGPGGANVAPAPPEHEENGNLIKPGFTTLPNLNGISQGSNAPPPAAPPVPIDSFATGVKAKGLADMIASGESLAQQQQYDRAIATYNDAIQVAPNNPLILTARANAELGGGYYAQASADLHSAITLDPAVLIGRYDLQKHLGSQRLKALSDDLKQAAQDSPKDSTHAFLYAYVLYNSHHVGMAAQWLSTADQRSGGKDPVIVDMKKYWNFNEESPAAPLPSTQPSMSTPSARPN
ncbi:MAG: tetratricopeptide repeat protein [Tepidisphaeraceae bacterium]|jgi:tetratricopeptide (TPR) repeat protein